MPRLAPVTRATAPLILRAFIVSSFPVVSCGSVLVEVILFQEFRPELLWRCWEGPAPFPRGGHYISIPPPPIGLISPQVSSPGNKKRFSPPSYYLAHPPFH